VRFTWRFYIGADALWHWQQIHDGNVVAESSSSFDTYDACVIAAQSQGYVFHVAQGRTVRPGNDRFPRR
jgi:hypothetical protein